MDEFLGMVKLFGGNFAIKGFALCDGQMVSIAENTPLYVILGTMYGGDGITTFALPKLENVKSANGQELSYQMCIQGVFPSRQ